MRHRGLIIGPLETEEEFARRVEEADRHETIEVFGLKPDWIHIDYSNKKLAPWEAGCAWIDQHRVRIQLRPSLLKRASYLGLVSKRELLQHEAIHAMRLAFDEPRFEEILAYQTSPSLLRRFFGPLFRSTTESALFASALLLFPLTLSIPALQIFYGCALTVLTGFGLVRLFRAQFLFHRAKKQLSKLTDYPLALMIHLKDEEIATFSSWSAKRIAHYIGQQKGKRWQQIDSLLDN